MNVPSPCDKACPGRNSTCHAECEKYLAWRARRNKLLEKQKQDKELDAVFSEMARKWNYRH